MRATLNILFAMLLLLAQGRAALNPHTIEKEVVCRCCSCGSTGCATPQRLPAPGQAPVVVQEISKSSEKVARPERTPLMTFAATRVEHTRPISSFVSLRSNQSLHQRLCVLLI